MKKICHITHWLLLLLGLLAFKKNATGQVVVTDFKIIGIVTDSSSQKKLDFITVNLVRDKNTVVKADYTKEDGSFAFSGIKPGKYTVVVVGVGYKNKIVDANLTDSVSKILDLGVVPISQQVVGLKEVTVSGTKQIVKQEIDRISYDLQADPESKVFSVLDMMRKVPHLSLDADNNIFLKGNADFKILINGKPSSMVERSYKEILRSMPASSIERIEVITTPPAKYDAEGLAGIINIITFKKLDNGYNGSINVSERFPVGGPGFGGSFSSKLGKWGMTAMGGGSIYNTPRISNSITRQTFGDDRTDLLQNGSTLSNSKSGYLGYEVSYELDSLNLLSGQFNINGNSSKGSGSQSSLLNGEEGTLEQYRLDNRNDGIGNGMDVALNYQKGFKADKNRLLTLSYRYFRFANDQNTDLSIWDRINYDLPDYRQVNDQSFGEQTVQVDYVYPLKKLNIEAGLKAIMRDNKSDFQYRSFDSETGDFELNPAYSNKFANVQNVYGAYNTYQYSFKSWGIKAGARIEQTSMSADFISTDSKVRQNYFNVIPSLSISKKFKKDNSGMNLGFTQRIQRPGIYQLNPFVDKSNPSFERTGNPNLRPALVNDFQLGYNRAQKGSFNISVGGTYFTDLIFQVSAYDPVTAINRISYGNTGTARLLMGNLSMNYPFTKRWNFNMNARVAHGKVRGEVNGEKITNRGVMYQIHASTGYRFEKDWRVNASFNANGPSINLQGTSNAASYTSFSVNKDVIKDKLSLSASVNNPFSKYRRDLRTTSGPDFSQSNYRIDYFRSFNVSLNYKFGKLKDAIKKNKRGIKNDDVQ
ncbi:outer membrane beta-barrel family protein [Dyadobacter sp. CY312]|uniref:outer membrane beta-barrel family protein n=1 Tax=Dyadobacter sp. CY312 TaxID=2907303 RepID=UPI001F21B6C8|nr:outer membrane beta-barrel family protein [Dyadobacter sp. CY312]MCE7040633.1 TonB-dependent receptor [Dyadobacter sp. CY312]